MNQNQYFYYLPTYQQKQYNNGNGYGLFQFDFMKSYYFKFLQDNYLGDSVESQV